MQYTYLFVLFLILIALVSANERVLVNDDVNDRNLEEEFGSILAVPFVTMILALLYWLIDI